MAETQAGLAAMAVPSRREDWTWLTHDLMAEVRRQEREEAPFGLSGVTSYTRELYAARDPGPTRREQLWLAVAAAALRSAMATRAQRSEPHPWRREPYPTGPLGHGEPRPRCDACGTHSTPGYRMLGERMLCDACYEAAGGEP